MIYLKHGCKVNFLKLPLISIYRWIKLIFENTISGRNAGCRSVVYRAGKTAFKDERTYQLIVTAGHTKPPRFSRRTPYPPVLTYQEWR
jgi:hypothetical protein